MWTQGRYDEKKTLCGRGLNEFLGVNDLFPRIGSETLTRMCLLNMNKDHITSAVTFTKESC